MKRFGIAVLLVAAVMLLPVCALSQAVDERLAVSLLPGYEYVKGVLYEEENEMHLLMRRPDGEMVFAGGVWDEQTGWRITESMPLPQDVRMGAGNLPGALVMNGEQTRVTLGAFADGTWGITLVDFLPLGPEWIGDGMIEGMLGDHPWKDITKIDWNTLPAGYEEALLQTDVSGWARVAIEEGKLNLHAQPDDASAVLGGYVRGAPVRVLEADGEWTRVDVLGLEGWMRNDSLAVGDAMRQIDYRGPWLAAVGGSAMIHEQPLQDSPAVCVIDDSWTAAFYVIGCYNDEWYHVWSCTDGTSGYIHKDDLWEGNG